MEAIIQKILDVVQNIGPWAVAVNGVLLALIGLFTLIPGEQPEKALRAIADFIEKYLSKK